MTLAPVPVEAFGGLNLLDDPGTLGWSGAIDLLNLDVEPGRIRTRGGYTPIDTAAANIDSIFPVPRTGGSDYIILGTLTPTLQVFLPGSGGARTVTRIGGGTGTTQTASAGPHNFVAFGTASAEYVYIANGTDQIRRLQASTDTFTAPAGLSSHTGNLLAVTPWDNRLVTNDATNLSRVWFSDAGTPETIGANNYIDLTPGDGERIVAMHAWRDLLFVFKPSRYYVFYGTSTDSSGNPIFNYRTINAGIGLDATFRTYAQRAVCAAPDGLYFLSYRGLFRTTGGPPEEVSGALRPIFYDAKLTPFLTTGSVSDLPLSLDSGSAVKVFVRYADGRIYVKTGLDSMFVYEIARGTWSLFSLPSSTIDACRMHDSTGGRLIFGAATAILYYARANTATTDNGTAITTRYRSGFSDLGTPDMKRIHSWRLQGTGTPTFKVSADFGALEAGAAVTLGTSPAVAEGIRRYGSRGRQFSWQVGGSTAWSLNNLLANVAGRRRPESRTT